MVSYGDNALTEIRDDVKSVFWTEPRLEGVEKLIWPSFRDFSFDPKCMPTS
jgi:hypothetical protein